MRDFEKLRLNMLRMIYSCEARENIRNIFCLFSKSGIGDTKASVEKNQVRDLAWNWSRLRWTTPSQEEHLIGV